MMYSTRAGGRGTVQAGGLLGKGRMEVNKCEGSYVDDV